MECPICGAQNKSDAVFCMSCGAPLPDMPFSQVEKKETARPPGGHAASFASTVSGEALGPVPGPPERPPAAKGPTPVMPAGSGAKPAGGAAGDGSRITSPGGFVFDAAAPPPPPAPEVKAPAAPPPPTAEMKSVVEEIIAEPKAPAAPPPRPAPYPAPKTSYYIPPEADYIAPAPLPQAPPREELKPAAETVAAQSQDRTQSMAPVAAMAAASKRERKVICPECYAPNPGGNRFCQECGSPLPVTGARQAALSRPAAGKPQVQQTAVLPAATQVAAAAQPAHPDAMSRAARARGDKSFTIADILAVLAIGAGAVAIALSYAVGSFTWKKGLDITMFAHQGAYTPGRTDLLGGPGILPYEGAEFFTVGLVAAIGLALALVFLAVRVGRGPMFILAGCIVLLPAAYLLFQALLPLRQMGIGVDTAVGLGGVFLGDSANAGAGLAFWIITAAGVLLVAAGFIAPPRGWGRLFTFLLCFAAILGVAFLCAACYNWNLFISQPAAAPQAGRQIALTVPALLALSLL
jgi:hypothetical protein